MMLNPISPAPSCATAWLAAATRLVELRGDAYNVVVDIDNPVAHAPADAQVILAVDRFLRERRADPISTVVNTIFPQDLFRRFGADGLLAEYERRFDCIKRKGWGHYFDRMVRWPVSGSAPVNQLDGLIDMLRKQLARPKTFRNVYELTLFNPVADKNRTRPRQCLSFLSFKHDPDRGLMLTAIYRNHYYIARALGNFIGLGTLMAFVAAKAGTKVGPLTCVSTHAKLDTATGHWTKQEAIDLLEGARALSKPQPSNGQRAAPRARTRAAGR
jgi:hypothetical protein